VEICAGLMVCRAASASARAGAAAASFTSATSLSAYRIYLAIQTRTLTTCDVGVQVTETAIQTRAPLSMAYAASGGGYHFATQKFGVWGPGGIVTSHREQG
jgi:hypothetical protein